VDEPALRDAPSTVKKKIEKPDIGFDSVRNEGERPLVVAVREGSEAARLGIAIGDTILKLNGKPVQQDVQEMLAASHPGDFVHLEIIGPAGAREIKLKLGAREEEQVTISDLPTVTAPERVRRKAWLAGEAEP
jgi:S1-C subfamily serine protease